MGGNKEQRQIWDNVREIKKIKKTLADLEKRVKKLEKNNGKKNNKT